MAWNRKWMDRIVMAGSRTAPAGGGASDPPLPQVDRFFHPVMAAGHLARKPQRFMLAGRPYVLFRDAAGAPAALSDVCPHRRAPLSEGVVRADGRLQCPYHGWRFDADGRGSSPSQPTLRSCDVASLQVVERYGYLWVASRRTAASMFPSMEWDGFEQAGHLEMLFRAPLHVALDNFSEDEHTPWVHSRLGWSERDAGHLDFEAHNHADRTEVLYRGVQRASWVLPLMLLRSNDIFENRWTTRFDPVRTEYELRWTDPKTSLPRPFATRITIFMVPETARTTRFHVFLAFRLFDERIRPLIPLLRRAGTLLVGFEVFDDARFVPLVADTPFEMRGMRLGKYDKPLVHNHKLLRQLYWGDGAPLVRSPVEAQEREA